MQTNNYESTEIFEIKCHVRDPVLTYLSYLNAKWNPNTQKVPFYGNLPN